MQRGSPFFLSLLLMASPVFLFAQEQAAIPKAGVVKVTAYIEGRQKIGTGFVVELDRDKTYAYIVTASHVVQGDDNPEVEFSIRRNIPAPATLVALEEGDTGLALLMVRGVQNLPRDSLALPLAPSVPLEEGEDVRVIGFPRLVGSYSVVRGSITALRGREIVFSGAIDEGISGGPMLMEENHVVGLVTGSAAPYGQATRASGVKEFLEGYGVKPLIVYNIRQGEVVRNHNQPPQISASEPARQRLELPVGTDQQFRVTATDPDNDLLAYEWTVDGEIAGTSPTLTWNARGAGERQVRAVVRDRGGLTVTQEWQVVVRAPPPQETERQPPTSPPPGPPPASVIQAGTPLVVMLTPLSTPVIQAGTPRVVMFTPPGGRFVLFRHQSKLFGVEVEGPGTVEPTLRYQWKLDGQPVSEQDLFEFQGWPVGSHEIAVTVTTSSGRSVNQRWRVEVREDEGVDPMWPARVKVETVEDTVVDTTQKQLTVTGKVRNIDERSADNIVVRITAFDQNKQPVARRWVLPTPQPLGPHQVGKFQASMPNLASIDHFRVETEYR